jgi:L-malate glycosyltransferase
MQVLQVVDTLLYGGAQKLLVTFVRQAQAHGVKTTVVSLYQTGGAPLRAELESYGARVIVLKSKRLFDWASFRQLWQLMRAERFDIVHTHLTYANINGGLAAWLTGLPFIATLHNTSADARHSHPLRDRLERWILRHRAHRVLAIGASVADIYRPLLRRELETIPNAVMPPVTISAAERAALRAELAGDAVRPICFTVGRFSQQKGYLDLLEAFAAVHTQMPEAVLVIAGDGTMRLEIEAKIKALALGQTVRLLGLRNDVPRLLAAVDVYVNASHWEGLPLAHLEAMMAGLPLAVTAVGEVPQLINADAGVLVSPQKPAELAAAILSLLADPARCASLGQAARQHALAHYGADAWFEKYLEMYRKVAA